jgi:hypothetical protein
MVVCLMIRGQRPAIPQSAAATLTSISRAFGGDYNDFHFPQYFRSPVHKYGQRA